MFFFISVTQIQGQVFDKGVLVDLRAYLPAYSRDVHVAWMTLVHDSDQNKFRPTSIFQKISVIERYVQKAPGGDLKHVALLVSTQPFVKKFFVLGIMLGKMCWLLSLYFCSFCQCAITRFFKSGTVPEVCTELLTIYGTSKKATVNRWIRCYSSLDKTVKDHLRELRTLPDSYVFDNMYLLGPGCPHDLYVWLVLFKNKLTLESECYYSSTCAKR